MLTLLNRLSAAEVAGTASHDFDDEKLDRREHRRFDFETQNLSLNRWEGTGRPGKSLGQIVDLSAGGIRIRTTQKNLRADGQIRVHLELPDYAGISPFIDSGSATPTPKREWVGWMAVSRVSPMGNGQMDVAGRLVDMNEMDRGMLSLYLSTQPLAA